MVQGENALEIDDWFDRNAVHHGLDQARYLAKPQPSVEESLNGDLVGRVQHGRCATSCAQRIKGQLQTGKTLVIRLAEIQLRDLREIDAIDPRLDTLRLGQRMRDWRAHVGIPKLRKH